MFILMPYTFTTKYGIIFLDNFIMLLLYRLYMIKMLDCALGVVKFSLFRLFTLNHQPDSKKSADNGRKKIVITLAVHVDAD